MERVQRFDRGGLGPPTVRPDGSLLLDAYLCRSGIQVYRQKDGTEVRELRPRSHICSDRHLASMAQRPVTIGHPPKAVTPDNARDFTHGSTGEHFEIDEVDGQAWVRGKIALFSQDAIAAVDAGARETSLGYTCRIESVPGKWNPVTDEWGPDVTDGLDYDAVQLDHEENHAAVLKAGKAWVDTTAEIMRLDGEGFAVAIDPQSSPALAAPTPIPPAPRGPFEVRADGATTMAKIPVNLVRKDANSKIVAHRVDLAIDHGGAQVVNDVIAMLTALVSAQEDEMGEQEKKLEEAATKESVLQAAVDAAKSDAVKAKADAEKARADAVSPETRKARRLLERDAERFLGEDFKVDGKSMDDLDNEALGREVKKAAIAKARPGLTLDGKDDAYLSALFEIVKDDLPRTSPLDDMEPASGRSDAAPRAPVVGTSGLSAHRYV